VSAPGWIRVLRPIERLIYKLCGVDADKEMNWREYAYAVLGISAVSLVVTYGFERLQHWLPWNPQGLANVGARSGLEHRRQLYH
jgi:K+-transporting ATPase ATPase A chain